MAEDKRDMKKNKELCHMFQYVKDAEYGIPKRCACGAKIVDDVAPEEAIDTLPGTRFFTCIEFQKDGFQYRQPWVLGIQEEVLRLRRRVEEGEKLKGLVTDPTRDCQKLREEVEFLNSRVLDLEMVL